MYDIDEEPTEYQMYLISQIEDNLGHYFQGYTKTEAQLFINKYSKALKAAQRAEAYRAYQSWGD